MYLSGTYARILFTGAGSGNAKFIQFAVGLELFKNVLYDFLKYSMMEAAGNAGNDRFGFPCGRHVGSLVYFKIVSLLCGCVVSYILFNRMF